MDEVERLFKQAERLEPPATLWRTIAARARAGDRAVPESGRAGRRIGRLAASLILGLAALAALLLVSRDPGKAGSAEGPRVAEAAGGDGPGAPVAGEEALLDEDVLAWHADLGDESAGDWDAEGWAGAVLAAPE